MGDYTYTNCALRFQFGIYVDLMLVQPHYFWVEQVERLTFRVSNSTFSIPEIRNIGRAGGPFDLQIMWPATTAT